MTAYHLFVRVILFRLAGETLQTLLAPAGQGEWEIPGGAGVFGKTLEETAAQTLPNETYLEQLYTYAGDTQVNVFYFALLPADTAHHPAHAAWRSVQDLPHLAHNHAEIIPYALRRLRYKLEYSAVGFELLPNEFTLSQLQHTYEIILAEKLDKRNFRRRILQAGIIEETPHRKTNGEGRPARLYRYKADAVAEVKTRRLFP